MGKKKRKKPLVHFLLRVKTELYTALKKESDKSGLSLNYMIGQAILDYLQKQKAAREAAAAEAKT